MTEIPNNIELEQIEITSNDTSENNYDSNDTSKSDSDSDDTSENNYDSDDTSESDSDSETNNYLVSREFNLIISLEDIITVYLKLTKILNIYHKKLNKLKYLYNNCKKKTDEIRNLFSRVMSSFDQMRHCITHIIINFIQNHNCYLSISIIVQKRKNIQCINNLDWFIKGCENRLNNIQDMKILNENISIFKIITLENNFKEIIEYLNFNHYCLNRLNYKVKKLFNKLLDNELDEINKCLHNKKKLNSNIKKLLNKKITDLSKLKCQIKIIKKYFNKIYNFIFILNNRLKRHIN